MTIDAVGTALLSVRIYALIIYLGFAAYHTLVLDRSTNSFSPGLRLLVLQAISRMWVIMMWVFLAATTAAGLGYAWITGLITPAVSSLPFVIVLEGVVSLLLVLTLSGMSYFLLRLHGMKSERVLSQVDEKFDRSAVVGATSRMRDLPRIMLLSWTNLVLSLVAVALGVLISAL